MWLISWILLHLVTQLQFSFPILSLQQYVQIVRLPFGVVWEWKFAPTLVHCTHNVIYMQQDRSWPSSFAVHGVNLWSGILGFQGVGQDPSCCNSHHLTDWLFTNMQWIDNKYDRNLWTCKPANVFSIVTLLISYMGSITKHELWYICQIYLNSVLEINSEPASKDPQYEGLCSQALEISECAFNNNFFL